tara:strand:- start:2562 stop:2840 length:279 start_codon:yes stop_codon:yes gene_type:complete
MIDQKVTYRCGCTAAGDLVSRSCPIHFELIYESDQDKIDKLRNVLENLLLLIKHETNLSYSAKNGITDPTGRIDEGEVWACKTMEEARLLLK